MTDLAWLLVLGYLLPAFLVGFYLGCFTRDTIKRQNP